MTTPTLLNFVLDQSGSMCTVVDATKQGFNTFLEEQTKVEGDIFLTLTLFNTSFQNRYTAANAREVPPLGSVQNPYTPSGGTSLLDAVGTSIKETEAWIAKSLFAGKVYTVILTDGQENSSHQWHLNQTPVAGDALDIGQLLTHKREIDNWEFVFMGSGGSEWLEKNFSKFVPKENFFAYSHNTADTMANYGSLSKGLTTSRIAGGSLSVNYAAEQQKSTVDPKPSSGGATPATISERLADYVPPPPAPALVEAFERAIDNDSTAEDNT